MALVKKVNSIDFLVSMAIRLTWSFSPSEKTLDMEK
jgi:hypothetical protein